MMSINNFVSNLAEQITIAFVGEINVTVQEQFTANNQMRIIELILKVSCFPIAVISHVDEIAVTKSELPKPVLINEFESPYEIKLKNAINNSTRKRLIGSVIHVYEQRWCNSWINSYHFNNYRVFIIRSVDLL